MTTTTPTLVCPHCDRPTSDLTWDTSGMCWACPCGGSGTEDQLAEIAAPVTLRFDRLLSGELVAVHSHQGRAVAAIVHPRHDELDDVEPSRRWCLAGQLRSTTDELRPHGTARSTAIAMGEAAQALGAELGIQVDAEEVTP